MIKSILLVLSFLVVAAVVLVFAPIALAQDPTDGFRLPTTAAEGLQLVLAWFSTFIASGYVASVVTDLVKKVPGLTDGDKSKISGALADVVVIVLTTAVSVGATYAGPLADWLDTSGVWNLLKAAIAVGGPALGIALLKYNISKMSKTVPVVAGKK